MRCMVLFCKTAGRTPGVTYFSLTTRRHDAWMKALGRDPTIEHLSQNNSVCSEHFLDQDKIIENNRCQLKPTAIPMLKLGIRKPLIPVQQGGEKSIKCEILEPNSHSTSHEQKIHEHIVQESVNGKQETYVIEKMKSTSPTMTYLETIDDSLRNGFRTPSNPAAGDYPVNTMVLVPCIIKIKREAVEMDSSSVKKPTKKEIKRARRDIELIHNYSTSPAKLIAKIEYAKEKRIAAYKKLKEYQKLIRQLKNQVFSLKEVIRQLKKNKVPDKAKIEKT